MKNETILKKAIEKAGDMGCGFEELTEDNGYYAIIFSHDFAKEFVESLTEEQRLQILDDANESKSDIEFFNVVVESFLKVLVLSEDRLKYIEKFL